MTELNNRLLLACTESFAGYRQIDELLTAGAEPLGLVWNDFGGKDNLYGVVVDYYFTCEEYSKLFEITKLFCQHGMDLSKPSVPYDDAMILNPVSLFTILMNDEVLPTLKYLLDYGLDAESAFSCWHHAVEYWFFVDGSMKSKSSREQIISDLRKILLIASYPYILDNDEYLQEIVCLHQNDYDITRLRDWINYDITIDTTRCAAEFPNVCNSLFTLIDKESGQEVWKVSFGRNVI